MVVVASLCKDKNKHRRSYAICQSTGRPHFFAIPPVPPGKLDDLTRGEGVVSHAKPNLYDSLNGIGSRLSLQVAALLIRLQAGLNGHWTSG
jgi:hypothetical protein